MKQVMNKILIGLIAVTWFTACGKMSSNGSKRSFSENYISPAYLENTDSDGDETIYDGEDIIDDYYGSTGGTSNDDEDGSSNGGSNGGGSNGSSNGGDSSSGTTNGIVTYPDDDQNPVDDDELLPPTPVDPAQRVRYYWACLYTMTGQKGAVWQVERLNKTDDKCKASDATVKANNPKAKIKFDGQVFMGYHEDNTDVPFHWRCNFTLKGEKGAIWKVRRHLKFDDNCVTAKATVKQNNPKATIIEQSETFLGYHRDSTENLYHWKCVYKLKGEKGATWDVERFLKFDDNCATATATVKANNPKAKIVSAREVFIGYHQ